MKLKQRTIYYQDELHDEFAGDHIKAKHIGQDYRYIRVRPLERMLHGFWYGIVAIPLARLYMKLHFSHKIINKEVLKQAGNSGFYLYGNHTHFLEALTWHTDCGDCIMIYPEAHIWPFYTGIRPFPDTSFRYPVQQKLPVFCLTNTYQRRGKSHIPQIVTYLDGPFYPDAELPAKLQKTQLRDQVYEAMGKRAQNSNMEMIRYIKKDTDREKSFI